MPFAFFSLGLQEVLVLAVLLVLGAAVAAYLLARSGSGKAREEAYCHFRCPNCRRRLRYHARQAGHAGSCSHCGHALTFPPASESID